FGKHAHHLEHCLSCRRRCVEALLVEIQVNLKRMNLGQELHQILQRAAETIDAPSHDSIEFPFCGIPTEAIELGSLISAFGTAHAMITVDLNDLAAHSGGNLPKLPLLIGCGLVERRNPQIDGNPMLGFDHRNPPNHMDMGERHTIFNTISYRNSAGKIRD